MVLDGAINAKGESLFEPTPRSSAFRATGEPRETLPFKGRAWVGMGFALSLRLGERG